jgi:hypothetical protein
MVRLTLIKPRPKLENWTSIYTTGIFEKALKRVAKEPVERSGVSIPKLKRSKPQTTTISGRNADTMSKHIPALFVELGISDV